MTDPQLEALLKEFRRSGQTAHEALEDARRFYTVMVKAHASNVASLHDASVRSAAEALDPSGQRLDALASVQVEENESLRSVLDRLAFVQAKLAERKT